MGSRDERLESAARAADAMRVVAELIERNADQEDKSAGLPIEACLDVIDHE